MKIVVSGASGLIGSALVPSLEADGHEVHRLVRREARSPLEISWDPTRGWIDRDRLAGTEAAVHLAGAGVGDHRWTPSYKKVILDSRVQGTRLLSSALAELRPLPRVMVSASGMHYYGDTGQTVVDEQAGPGAGFLVGVVEQWEAAAEPARAAGIRVAHPRTGLVLTAKGGALARMLPIFRLGLGGRLGSGRQFWSYITLEDEVRAIRFLLDGTLQGPVNLTAPHPVPNRDVTAALARLLRRPALVPVPAFALRLVLGEFSSDVLASLRVTPGRLTAAGFSFNHPDIESALRAALNASPSRS